jgi:hypothetical protein
MATVLTTDEADPLMKRAMRRRADGSRGQRARELRAGIGDPAVRDALDPLSTCLAERFGGDIALGTGPVAAGGPHDIALGEDRAG